MKLKNYPLNGKFGKFGGRFVPETLIPALEELEKSYLKFRKQNKFNQQLEYYLKEYAGRPTPLYLASNLTKAVGGAKIYLKREDLLHGGAHKINNTIGQALLAKKMGKERVIAETGAGQHGVATAMACSSLGLKCEVYMGSKDVERQKLNVFRMKLLGAEIHPVHTGSQTLKDAINESLRDWITNIRSTYYLLGSVVGPHPYPMIVRNFQRVIGREIKQQAKKLEKKMPNAIIACVGGGSNAIGAFYEFLDNIVPLYGVEAGGEGLNTEKHSATLCAGTEGILHGMFTYLLQNGDGQIIDTHSIAAGLDYPGVGPEHSFLKSMKRVKYTNVNDVDAVKAFLALSKYEGIIPALEPAHAIGYAMKIAKNYNKNDFIVVALSGRGDKDVQVVERQLGINDDQNQ